jgi:glutamine synthetase
MSHDLAQQAADKNIAYFLISFVDLFGTMRAKLVPAVAIGAMQRDGAAFAGFSTHLDLTPADPDMFAVPDPETLTILPWQPDIGWVMADIIFEAPRSSSRRGRC